MNRLFQAARRALGIHFAPDNHVIPVLRFGRYHRVVGSGFCWLIPFVDQPLPQVYTGLHAQSCTLHEVVSADNIPFSICLTVLYGFDPASLPRAVAAQQVRASEATLRDIVQDYASQGLRRLVSTFTADVLCGKAAMSRIERDLGHLLRLALRPMGLVVQRNGGVLIKEVVAPDRFRRSMLDAVQHESTLNVLGRVPDDELVMRVIVAEFLTRLGERNGNLAFLSPLDAMHPLRLLGMDGGSDREGHQLGGET